MASIKEARKNNMIVEFVRLKDGVNEVVNILGIELHIQNLR